MNTFYDKMLDHSEPLLDRNYTSEEIAEALWARSSLDDAYDKFNFNAYTLHAYQHIKDMHMLSHLLEKTRVKRHWPDIQNYVEATLQPDHLKKQINKNAEELRWSVRVIMALQMSQVSLSLVCELPSLWGLDFKEAEKSLQSWLNDVVTYDEVQIYPSI